jgi:hypothetical protein
MTPAAMTIVEAIEQRRMRSDLDMMMQLSLSAHSSTRQPKISTPADAHSLHNRTVPATGATSGTGLKPWHGRTI